MSRQLLGRPVGKASPTVFERVCWQQTMRTSMPAPQRTALLDEWAWEEGGRQILFPVEGLLPRLYRARIDVTVDEFRPPFPSFLLAIPTEERFGGMSLPGCIVSLENIERRKQLARGFAKVLELPLDYTSDAQDLREILLRFTVHGMDAGRPTVNRWVMPFSQLAPLLACEQDATEDLRTTLSQNTLPGALAFDGEDHKLAYRLTKLVVGLCVYLRACPEAMVPGIPPPAKPLVPYFSQSYEVGRKHIEAERAAPLGHWREWHFRRYPLRPNGTRRAGVVFVTGSWVSGREQVHTVENVRP